MNSDAAQRGLSATDLTFFKSDDNWAYGPQLLVELSYRTLAEANAVAQRVDDVIDSVTPWKNPWQPETVDETRRGCVIVAPSGLLAPFGMSYFTFNGRRSNVRDFLPGLCVFIPPAHLERSCGIDTFWRSTEPTPPSIRLFEYLMSIARRAYAAQPFEYGKILDETWGFSGSAEHNPCIATYHQFAEAAGWNIVGRDQGHALISAV